LFGISYTKDATFAELAVVQLARLYIMLRKIPHSRPGVPVPYEHSGNSVAYPLESHVLLKRIGLRSQDLPKYLSVVFEGEDRSVVRGDRNLRVRTIVLRRMFGWLLFNCWPWMVDTQSLEITANHFGESIEETIASYESGSSNKFRGILERASHM